MMRTQEEQSRFLFIRVIIDYLKTNGHRIAHHSLSRTENPLASRNDIKPLLSIVDGDTTDILTLDAQSNKTFVKLIIADQLIAHFPGDIAFSESISSIDSSKVNDVHFMFISNGIFTPSFLKTDYQSEYSNISKITFLETRFDSNSVHKIDNPTIYLRKAIGQIREIETTFTEVTGDVCDCGGNFMRGAYNITYWEKKQKLNYSICDNCGIQKESSDNASITMNFLMGLSAE
jgi:hypothetical protein